MDLQFLLLFFVFICSLFFLSKLLNFDLKKKNKQKTEQTLTESKSLENETKCKKIFNVLSIVSKWERTALNNELKIFIPQKF